MKIAITGGTAGIGQALAKIYDNQGHETVILSRRNGYNIRSLPKVASMIESCDMFINNAQVGFAQTELMWEIWQRWRDQHKFIVNISTKMTGQLYAPTEDLDQYIVQKKALELAHDQCQHRSMWPKMILIQPGRIATQPGWEPPIYEDVDNWAKAQIELIEKTIL
jgi:nucleoside-diphosphate-sugar epimerase